MWEVIKIILIICAGIVIGLCFGYLYGFNKGWKLGCDWYEKKSIIKNR